jgi:hypothetical protein
MARNEDAGVGSGNNIISCAFRESLGRLAYIAGKCVTRQLCGHRHFSRQLPGLSLRPRPLLEPCLSGDLPGLLYPDDCVLRSRPEIGCSGVDL